MSTITIARHAIRHTEIREGYDARFHRTVIVIRMPGHRCGFVLALCMTIGCGDPTPPPPPTSSTPLTIHVESPTPTEGAGVISIQATDVDSVSPTDDSLILTNVVGNRMFVVVIRQAPGGISFTTWVRDERTDLNPSLIQVADPANQLRGDLRGYLVRVVP